MQTDFTGKVIGRSVSYSTEILARTEICNNNRECWGELSRDNIMEYYVTVEMLLTEFLTAWGRMGYSISQTVNLCVNYIIVCIWSLLGMRCNQIFFSG